MVGKEAMPLKKVEKSKWASLLPKGYLSPSAVESFLLCPHAWYLRYVVGVKPLGIYPATQEGKAMHAMLEENNREKVNTGDDMKPKQAVECFQDHWSDYSKEVTNWEGEKKDTISERGEAQSNNYIKKHASKYVADPDGIEKKISFEIAGIPFLGFIDFQGDSTMKDLGSSIGVRTDKVILDYKNVKSAKSLTELKTGIQMGVYAEATGIRTVEYISFVKTKSPRIDKNTVQTLWIRARIPSEAMRPEGTNFWEAANFFPMM